MPPRTKKLRIPLLILALIVVAVFVIKDPTGTFATFTKYQNSLNRGLVAYYTFDGKDVNWSTGRVTDMSGNGNVGTLKNMSTSTSPVAGKFGQALYFAGIEDDVNEQSVRVPDPANGSLDFGTIDPFSVSVWFKGGPNGCPGTMVSKKPYASGSDSAGWSVWTVDCYQTDLHYSDGLGNDCFWRTGYVFQDMRNRWTNIIYTVDASRNIVAYANGASTSLTMLGSNCLSVGSLSNSSPLTIGNSTADTGGYNYAFKGTVDDVRIYNRVLSQSDVTQLYKQGAGNKVGVTAVKPKDVSMSQTFTQVASDDFNRADANPAGGNWATVPGNQAIKIASNTVNGSAAANDNCAVWTANTFSNDQYSEAVFTGGVDEDGPAVRASTTAQQFYIGTAGGIWKFDGSWSQISSVSGGYSSGDKIGISAVGSNLRLYKNGVYVPGSLLTDTSFPTGRPGICVWENNASTYDNWAGGDATNIPALRGILAHWTFDGKDTSWTTGRVNDVSGNSNTGTIQGLPTSTSAVSGKIGQGMYFNGTGYVTAGALSDMELNDWTTSAWVKTRTINTVEGSNIVSKTGYFCNGTYDGWAMTITTTGRLGGALSNGASCTGLSSPDDGPIIADGTWHHIVVVWNRTSNLLRYVDGVLVGSAFDISNRSANSMTTSQPYTIGLRYPAAGVFDITYTGSVDDVRVYNYALTAADIATLYKSGSNKAAISPTTSANPLNRGLLGYWTFDGKDTSWTTGRVTDVSGNNNPGTLQRMSTTTSVTPGKIGQALYFDGSASYVALPASYINTSGSFSIWMRTLGMVSSPGVMVGNLDYTQDADGASLLLLGNGTLSVEISDNVGPTVSSATSLARYDDGRWHHVVGTWSPSTITLYVDGASVTSSGVIATATTGVNSCIGKDCLNNNYYYKGYLDDVRIYNRELTATEVAQLYGLGRGTIR